MKKITFAIVLMVALMSCRTQYYNGSVYKRQGFLKYDGKTYTFVPLEKWTEFTPNKTNDTLFQYVIVKRQ